jgi:sulfur-carrier protein adenylyltransferase/sulfurtransferase
MAILDVREPRELEIACLNRIIHIPMGELPQRLSELAQYKDQELVVYCRSGGRSARCIEFLQANGFNKLINLKGGIHAWADLIEPTMQKY